MDRWSTKRLFAEEFKLSQAHESILLNLEWLYLMDDWVYEQEIEAKNIDDPPPKEGK